MMFKYQFIQQRQLSRLFIQRIFLLSLLLCTAFGTASAQVDTKNLIKNDTKVTNLIPPSPYRGIYAIWYKNEIEKYLKVPYIAGGQIALQWSDLEPKQGQYNFLQVSDQLSEFQKLGKKTTIQINGNLKPTWLFEKVPFYSGKLDTQVYDSIGTLMYWHPVYRNAYIDLLKAFALYLEHCPNLGSLAGIRLNYNAIGTEKTQVPKNTQDLSKWTVPKGVEPGVPWSSKEVQEYEKEVVDTYIKYISPYIKILVRNNLDQELENTYRSWFENGTLGWFHTSTEAEPRSAEAELKYIRFYLDCRSGKTLGYAEPWASAWGKHGGKTDDRPFSPPQWNYWCLLLDMHCGVSCIAIYAGDLNVAITGNNGNERGNGYSEATDHLGYQNEFTEAFRFAAKYAGYHASPEVSPGTWIAFRESHESVANNAKNRTLSFITGDYTFLMERMPDESQPVCNVGPTNQRQGAWARELPAAKSMKLKLDPRFASSIKGGTVRITYLDRKEDAGTKFQFKTQQQVKNVMRNGSGRWETVELKLSDGPLVADKDGAHLTLTPDSKGLCLHMVEVVRK